MGHSSSVLGVTASVVSDTSLSLDFSQEEEFISYSDRRSGESQILLPQPFLSLQESISPFSPSCLPHHLSC